jgi:hypothetical protein
MNPTGKAGRPRNKPPELKGDTQFQRFVETAKALESDESGKAFEKALGVVLPKPVATPAHSSSKTPSQ